PQDHEALRFEGGVWFVDLTTTVEMEQFWQILARVLMIAPRQAGQLKDDVLNFLSAKALLLILDNCEQIKGLRRELSELLRLCPSVKCIATTRSVIGVAGEKVYEVEPLPVPSAARPASLKEYDSVELFAERAKSADNGF